jgi:hypothetical protein
MREMKVASFVFEKPLPEAEAPRPSRWGDIEQLLGSFPKF